VDHFITHKVCFDNITTRRNKGTKAKTKKEPRTKYNKGKIKEQTKKTKNKNTKKHKTKNKKKT